MKIAEVSAQVTKRFRSAFKDLKVFFQNAENGIKSDDIVHLSGIKWLAVQKWTTTLQVFR
jgi:hypothetical protein